MTEVVPAFFELLRERRVVDWLSQFLKRREFNVSRWERSHLARFPTCLKPDLSWVGPYDLKDTYGDDWRQRWSYCAEGSEGAPSEDTAEQVNWLFKIAVSIKCLGASQFVGRSKTTSYYSDLLPELGVKEDDRIVELLAALGKRDFLIGYQFGFGFEGVNGWLDSSETAELAKRLDVLPLPRYEGSFAAMEQFRTGEWGEYECPDFSVKALSLSFVRTTAAIAARDHRGLLWGNGVMPPEYYSSV